MTDKDLKIWIVENIMEWQKFGYGIISHGCGFTEPAKYGWYTKTGGMAHPDVDEWHPMESESDALQAVDKLLSLHPNWVFTLDVFGDNYQDKQKAVATFQESTWAYIVHSCVGAETKAKAICLACKAAVEGVE